MKKKMKLKIFIRIVNYGFIINEYYIILFLSSSFYGNIIYAKETFTFVI